MNYTMITIACVGFALTISLLGLGAVIRDAAREICKAIKGGK
jgi:hypothetical protein